MHICLSEVNLLIGQWHAALRLQQSAATAWIRRCSPERITGICEPDCCYQAHAASTCRQQKGCTSRLLRSSVEFVASKMATCASAAVQTHAHCQQSCHLPQTPTRIACCRRQWRSSESIQEPLLPCQRQYQWLKQPLLRKKLLLCKAWEWREPMWGQSSSPVLSQDSMSSRAASRAFCRTFMPSCTDHDDRFEQAFGACAIADLKMHLLTRFFSC